VPEQSLEQLLQEHPDPLHLMRHRQTGPNVYPVVLPEYTNWRDEQRAWQESCVLFNQSYHMADLHVRGPEAFEMLNSIGVNTFKNFRPGVAKQFVTCNYDGYVVGDAILFYLDDEHFNVVGREPALHWTHFHADTGNWKVEAEYDERSASRPDPLNRKTFRFQLQGPTASNIIEKVTGAPVPEVKFFQMEWLKIAGVDVRALRHGMAGQAGFELFGEWQHLDRVLETLIEAGQEFGLHLSGGRAYSSNTLESGWIPCPLPAIFTGEKMKPYREWLPASSFEATASLGGSFNPARVEDCYLTPWDLGYGQFVKFDHDFIGRQALEKMAGEKHRKKVTLALENDDVLKVIGSALFGTGSDRAKFIEFPSAVYSLYPYDKVTANGRDIGISTWIGYSYNQSKMLTLATIEEEFATPGTEVTLVWGEEGGGTAKPRVERHVQAEIRAIVSAVPYAPAAREIYADAGWRKRSA